MTSPQLPHPRKNIVRMLIYVDRSRHSPAILTLANKYAEVASRRAVEMEARDRFPIIIVEENGAIGLCVAHHDALGLDQLRAYCADDVEPVDFHLSGLDSAWNVDGDVI